VALGRMSLSQVSLVASLEEAGQICTAGGADACVVVLRNPVYGEVPLHCVEPDAPGKGSVPSLLLADVVTPYVRRTARRSGYGTVLPLAIPQSLLYRGIRGLLQRARRRVRPPRHAESRRPKEQLSRKTSTSLVGGRADLLRRKLS
jgi:hypothetical protein